MLVVDFVEKCFKDFQIKSFEIKQLFDGFERSVVGNEFGSRLRNVLGYGFKRLSVYPMKNYFAILRGIWRLITYLLVDIFELKWYEVTSLSDFKPLFIVRGPKKSTT